ncbi:MAG: hypothetical protein ACK2U5_22440 [Candidatus Promineifilaceae bacterium]|jgi:hypothetical protein
MTDKTATAFKHPQCGGLIYMVREGKEVFFECNTCLKVAEELERLAVGKPVILRRGKRSESKEQADSEPVS